MASKRRSGEEGPHIYLDANGWWRVTHWNRNRKLLPLYHAANQWTCKLNNKRHDSESNS